MKKLQVLKIKKHPTKPLVECCEIDKERVGGSTYNNFTGIASSPAY